MDEQRAVTDLLYGPGIPMLGQEMPNDEAIVRVHEQFPFMAHCVVRDWIWLDLDMPELVRTELEKTGRQAVMLYAHRVVYDSNRRFEGGDWVRSTPLVAFSEGCFFRTLNTVYVLVGHGVRKRVDLSTVVKVF